MSFDRSATTQLGSVLKGVAGVSGGMALILGFAPPGDPPSGIGFGVIAVASLLALLTLRRRSGPFTARLFLGGSLAGLGLVLAYAAPAIQVIGALGLCFVVIVAGTWERQRLAAGAWTFLAVAVYIAVALGRTLVGSGQPPPWLSVGITLVAVPAGLVALSRHAQAIAQNLAHALDTSEIARAKLQRSNRELGSSMQRTEAALGKLSTIVDNLADGLVAVSLDGSVEIANHAFTELLGLASVARGESVESTLPEQLRELIGQCVEAEELVVEELPLEGGRTALAAASPVQLERSLWGTVVLVRDVTLQKEIDRMKSDFAATVSHEMRTPLTSILGFSKMIRRQLNKSVFPFVSDDEEKAVSASRTVRGNLEIIIEEGNRLSLLINDVLDISKMESGQMQWDLQPHAPEDLVRRAMDVTRPLFDGSSVQTKIDIEPDLPLIEGDKDRLHQVLVNLIGNASKFTEEGTVTASAKTGPGTVEFAIRDTGIGIPPVHRESVFEKFKQVGDTLTDRPRGTGLGLPICREIVLHHGGRIWVEEAESGACIAFTIPIKQEPRSDDTRGKLTGPDNKPQPQEPPE